MAFHREAVRVLAFETLSSWVKTIFLEINLRNQQKDLRQRCSLAGKGILDFFPTPLNRAYHAFLTSKNCNKYFTQAADGPCVCG